MAKENLFDIKNTAPGAGVEPNLFSEATPEILEPTSPTTMISSDDGIREIQDNEKFLNEISPETAPGVEPPEPPSPDDNQFFFQGEGKKQEEIEEPEEPTPAEGTTFTLEEAQELFGTDFTGLTRTPEGKFIADASALERLGITGLEEDEEEKAEIDELKSEVKEIDNRVEGLVNDFLNLNIDQDPDFQAQAETIRAQFAEMRNKMVKINASRRRALQSRGFRRGTVQFAGDIQAGIESEELTQANTRILAINTAESAAISAARRAFKNDEITEFNNQINAIQLLRQNKADEITKYNEALLATNERLEKEQEKLNKQERDDNIRFGVLSAINQGLTNPLEILSALEFAGIDANPEDVTKFTNLIENEDILKNLKGDLFEFEWMKKNRPKDLQKLGADTLEEYRQIVDDSKIGSEKSIVIDLLEKYPDANILPTDSLDVARSKLPSSKKYQKEVKISGSTIDKDEKEITKFRNEAGELMQKLFKEEIDWGTAFDTLKLKYPQASNDAINGALGGGIPFDPLTGEFDTSKAFGRAI